MREVGEAEQVEAILKRRYSRKAVKCKDFEPNRKDIDRFVALVEKEPASAEFFADYYIFELADGKWGKPDRVYLDLPFLDTGLSAYYEALGKDAQRDALAKSYEDCGMSNKKIAVFAQAVGAQTSLMIEKTNCHKNPQWDYLSRVPGKRKASPINDDYHIPKLRPLLKEPTIGLSRLIWRTMNLLPSDTDYLHARYRKNSAHGFHYASSQLVHHLRNAAWVPQTNGESVRPSDAFRELLPEGFPFDAGQKWLEEVEFGLSAKKQSEEYEVRDQQARKMGFKSAEEAGKALELAKLCRQSGRPLDELIAQLEPDVRNERPTFPERASSNIERRRERTAEQLGKAPNKEYEQRDRRTRTTREAIEPELWLRNQYTNEAGQMICQICKEEMPFRKRDGEHYFESVEVLSIDHFPKEHEAQFLALCPLCAAMYKEFVKQDEGAMADLKNVLMNTDDFEVSLHLGELGTSIRFVETHFHDIKTILKEQE